MTVFVLHKETILIPLDEIPSYESHTRAKDWIEQYCKERGFYPTECLQLPEGLRVEVVQRNAERKDI